MPEDQLPAPLTPPDCDLQQFPYMELDVVRLRQSKFSATPNAEAFRAGVLLWCASWHQLPAASLPDDDVELADLAGYGKMPFSVRHWKKVRAEALDGFIKCSDGRLYHKVIAEKANAAWASRLDYFYDKLKDRIRKENKAREKAALPPVVVPPFEEWISAGRPDRVPGETDRRSAGTTPAIPAENGLKGKGNGEGEGKGDSLDLPGGASPPPAPTPAPTPAPPPPAPPKPAKEPPPTNATWEAYAAAYERRYHVPPVRNQTVNGLLAQVVKRLGADEAPQVAAFYVSLPGYPDHKLALLVRDCEGVRTRWATNNRSHPTAAAPSARVQRAQEFMGRFATPAPRPEDDERTIDMEPGDAKALIGH